LSGLPVAVQVIPFVLSLAALVEARRAVNLARRPEPAPPVVTDRVDQLIGEIMDWETMRRVEEWADSLDWEDDEE
jgi:hypothetical protein